MNRRSSRRAVSFLMVCKRCKWVRGVLAQKCNVHQRYPDYIYALAAIMKKGEAGGYEDAVRLYRSHGGSVAYTNEGVSR
jgi:hypothetical protein